MSHCLFALLTLGSAFKIYVLGHAEQLLIVHRLAAHVLSLTDVECNHQCVSYLSNRIQCVHVRLSFDFD
jgi:hypothetical protein